MTGQVDVQAWHDAATFQRFVGNTRSRTNTVFSNLRATLHSLVHVTRVHAYLPAAQHVLANLTYYLKKLLISVLNQVLSAVKNKESAFKSGSLPSNILSQ